MWVRKWPRSVKGGRGAGGGCSLTRKGRQDAAGGGALLAAGRGVLRTLRVRAQPASAVAGGPGGPRSGGQCSTGEV